LDLTEGSDSDVFRTLVDDKTMYTGSEKSIRILVKNIKVSTTAGPISRPSIGTFVNRP